MAEEQFLAAAVDAAKNAGEIIRKSFYLTKNVEHKGQVDLVTETDKACEDLISNHLRMLYPDHKFIGEETSAALGSTDDLTSDPTWIVDPLDGTTNFVHGFPFVCVSIGLTIGKIPTVGVVYNPIMNELFTAVRGKGAFLNGSPIKTSPQNELVKALMVTEDGHPVAYLSKALGVRNQRLSIYEEFLAVMMAVDKWRPYLQRVPFTIVTDHKSLCHLSDQQLETELQRKAMSKMVGLQFSFKYRRGPENSAADALSRVGHLLSIDALSVCQPQWLQEVMNSYETDTDSKDLLQRLALCSPDEHGYELRQGITRHLLQRLALCSPDEHGYELRQGITRLHSKIWIGANIALQTKLINAFHTSAIGGHSGVTAMYQRVKKLFAWRGLKQAVEEFVRQCSVCQHAKHEHLKTPGLLQSLPIPTEPWRDLTMDFVEGLPASEGYEVIMVVVDCFTKHAHFVPLHHPFTAATVARAFWDNIIKLHGVPHSIVSDHDKIFTSAMWRALLEAAGTKLSYSTAYHPQTDGQSERVNQCLEMYLRCAVHEAPKQWRKWLPTAEFWYNTTHHSSLKTSTFRALYGQEPNLGGLPSLSLNLPENKDADLDWATHNDRLRAQLAQAQNRCKQKADRNRTERSFNVGEQVLLKLQPYAQSIVANRPCPKLAFKFFGPFIVEQCIGTRAYKLALPADSRIHPVFHVSQLKPFTPDYSPVLAELPRTPDLTAAPLQPEVILDRRMVKKGNTSIVQVGTKRDKSTLDDTTNIINKLLFKIRSIRMCGSLALNMCGVACGRLDLCYEIGFGGPWDVAAGALILKEAGGFVFDPSGDEFDLMAQRMAGSNGHLKDQFIKALGDAS